MEGGGGWALPGPPAVLGLGAEGLRAGDLGAGGWLPALKGIEEFSETVNYKEVVKVLTSSLENAGPGEVEEFVSSPAGSLALLQWRLLGNLRKKSPVCVVTGATVTASSCPERAGNLVDGTDSEWWTGDETAWVEVNLQRDCQVERLSLQWWGISTSRDYTVLAATNQGDFVEVGSTSGEVESPEGYNSWSRLGGWALHTRRVRIQLREGTPDPWGKGKCFGLRRVQVEGAEVKVASPSLQQVVERKVRRCLADHRGVQADVCSLIAGNSS